MSGRIVRWGAVLALGALWWWAVLRLALVPGAGAVEGAVVAGGWGLSVLPVHCVPKTGAAGDVGAGRFRRVWETVVDATATARSRGGAASPRRRG
ncbi:hypothetical protein [Streptomyces sp. S.PNR 29]|uniref:hypothetical protein n=1 Tax=Streptomyces sp. S.PNR 29 TaxID=2973805 RepID=UPI0025B1517D|nr:hypothetical protein [Streptomyces sp. S.PNR 29]MDN0197592.1 hypothetical protein [Streptomyces sp. S.PNR 29]